MKNKAKVTWWQEFKEVMAILGRLLLIIFPFTLLFFNVGILAIIIVSLICYAILDNS